MTPTKTLHPPFYILNVQSLRKVINNLNSKKSNTYKSISSKILKHCSESTVSVLQNCFNRALVNECFPDNLNLVDITAILKRVVPTKTKNGGQ